MSWRDLVEEEKDWRSIAVPAVDLSDKGPQRRTLRERRVVQEPDAPAPELIDTHVRGIAQAAGKAPPPPPSPTYTPSPKGKYEDEWKRLLGDQGSISAPEAPSASLSTVGRGVANTFKAMGESVEQGIHDTIGVPSFVTEGRQVAENSQLRDLRQAFARQDTERPQFDNPLAQGLYGAVESTIMQLPGIVGSVAVGNPAPALAWAGATTSTQGYGKYRARGATPGEAALGGAGEGAVEVATELIPMGGFIKAFGKEGGQAFLKQALKSVMQDVPGEQIATLAQDAIDTAIANPDKTWDEYVKERPEAALVTAIATMGQGAIMTGGGYAAKAATDRLTRPRAPDAPTAPTIREQAMEQAAASITPEDEASPIDTADIVAGRTEMAVNEAAEAADSVLGVLGMPKVGKPVTVTTSDGRTLAGTMEHAFKIETNEYGSSDGISVRLEDGSLLEGPIDELRDRGLTITENTSLSAQFAATSKEVAAAFEQQLGPMEAPAVPTWQDIAEIDSGPEEPLSSPKSGPMTAPSSRPNPVDDGGAIVRSIFGDKARITSTYRGPNHPLSQKNPNSWHTKSHAAVDIAPIPGMTFAEAKAQIEAKGYNLLEAINEVGKGRTKHATGDHWHFVLGKGGAPVGSAPDGEVSNLATDIATASNLVRPDDEERDDTEADRQRAADNAAAQALLDGPEEAVAPDIAGEPVDNEWVKFKPESGTLAIPRADMPQIKAENRGAMVNFLNARGIQHAEDTVAASSLKPTQSEFSTAKVKKAMEFEGGNRAILVSQDGHVVDGHHQWLAARDKGEDIRVIRLGAPVRDIINTVADMPSTFTADGADVPKVDSLTPVRELKVGDVLDYGRENLRVVGMDGDRPVLEDGTKVAPDGPPKRVVERAPAPDRTIRAERADTGPTGPVPQADMLANPQVSDRAERAATAPIPRAPSTSGASRADTAVTTTGREIPVEYAVVDLKNLVTSHNQDGAVNPAFPAELQPRDRSRDASATQIADIAARLDPRLLGQTPKASDGAPIISPSGVVESGNGRTLAIGRAYDLGGDRAEAYRQFVADQGFDVSGIERPVLVRVRQNDMGLEDVEAFTREANQRDTAGFSATEQAVSDARALPASVLSRYRGGDLDTAGNRDFVRAFIAAVVPESERASMIASDGSMSQDAMRRIGAAMVQRAYGNPHLVAKLSESTDNNIKAIGGALSDVSTAWAEMVEAAREGAIDPAMDITANLNEAVEIVDRARREGKKVADLVNQTDIFSGDKVSPMTEAVLLLMFRNRAMTQPFGREKLAEQLRWYVTEAMQSRAEAGLFGEAGRTAPGEVLSAARNRIDDKQAGQQPGLLDRPDAGNGEGVPEGSQPRERDNGGQLPRTEQASEAEGERGLEATAGTAETTSETGDIGKALAARIADDFAAARAEYETIDNIGGDSEGGRVLNTDIARELSPEYRADRSRATEVHTASSNFIKKLFAQKLKEPAPDGLDDIVLFTAGGAGAGKSTGMELVPDAKHAGIIYDTTMDKLESSISKIEQALEAGWIVKILYTYREPLESLENGVLQRAEKVGRTVPISVLVNTHLGARKVIDALAERYKNDTRVDFIAIDNSRGKDNAAIVPLADIPPLTDDRLSERAERIVRDAYDKGRITAATLGGTLEGRTGRSGPDPKGNEPRDRPGGRSQPEQERPGAARQGLAASEPQEETPPAAKPVPSANTAFTDDAYQAAKRRMAERKRRLNSGVDPEMLLDAVVMAGYHIEKGARTFAAYADAFLADMAEAGWKRSEIIPHLRQFYENVRYDPRTPKDVVAGMSGPEDIGAALARLEDTANDDTIASDETATDKRNGSSDRGGMGSPGEQEAAGNGRPDGFAVGEEADRPLAGAQPQDGSGPRETEPTRAAGVRAGGQDARAGEGVPESGDAADGREGASGAGLASQGARGRNSGGVSRPDFSISDPAKIIGGTPKVRFANNQAAIEAYERVLDKGREPTKAELQAMAGYTGWGSFGQELFQGTWERPMPKDNWANESDWLRSHMGEENWKSAQASIINAHYTDPPTVQAMWAMVEKLGFKGGRVLEPSMGIGNFFSLMPKRLRDASDLTGIEMDKLTGGMAKMLFPNSTVHVMPYQDSRTPDDFYDLVIGNWPFAADGPADRRYMKLAPSLHDFFFLKALDQTRPGGLVVGVTSSGTMDKVGRATRMELAKKADLVAAFRLPTGAFEEYAGTAVVTDILVFQKRDKPLADAGNVGWIDTVKMEAGFGQPPLNINEYWQSHPDAVLGKLGFGRSTQGRPGMMVTRPDDLRERLAALPKKLKKVYTSAERGNEPRFITNNSTDRHGSVTVNDAGDLYQVQGERLVRLDDIAPRKLTAKDVTQAKALVGLRKGYAGLIDAERDGADNVEDLRKALDKDYQAFRKAYGPVTDSPALKLFKKLEDPGASILAALEKPDGSPSQILTQPMVRSARRLENPSVLEAFVFERNKGVGVNLEAIAAAAGTSPEQAAQALLDSKAVYRLPGGGYEVADVYLSGNVRQKLAEAKLAADQGEDMAASITALEAVIPENIPYYQIEAKLGATWVPGAVYEQFIADLLNASPDKISIKYIAGRWQVELKDRALDFKSEATTQWGTERIAFGSLLRHAFNNTSPKLQTKDLDGNVVLDEAASQAAAEKATLIREEFGNWVFREPLRRVELERAYNEIMNAIATPQYDGSFLEFPGMALEMYGGPLSLRSHQVNAVWQGLATGRGLFAHEVGTGKTLTIGGIAVEGRRFGIHRKPLVLAHNANSATVAAEINEMYPGAAVLYIDNLSPDTIKTTLRRIRNEDWDAVVMPHSVLDRITLSRETLDALAADEIALLEEEALKAAEDDNVQLTVADMDDPDKMKKVRSVTAKNLVHARNRIIANIEKQAIRAAKDGAVLFEELGIDAIIVDEAHVFKKPPIATRMQLKGLNTATSNRSIALNFLTSYVKRNRGGQGTYLFTGTPITNTLTEIFNMQRYVMDDVMAKDGIDQWDAWFNTFANASSDVELNAAGEYEPVTRLASFVNVAELRRMAGQFLDIVFADDMPEFKPRETPSGKKITDPDLTEDERANLVDGRADNPIGRPYKKIINDVAPMGAAQAGIMDILVERSKKFRNAAKKERRELMLKGDPSSPVIVETDAANASLDVRLYEEAAPDEPQSKVNRAAENIVHHYREHKMASQVVFMERGFSDTATRKGEKVKRLNLAKDLTDKLEKQGIPRSQIAIVDGSTSKVKRKEIAAKMKRAEIRVVIGSTATLGTGVNMQDNLRAMHHLDAPWMPGELEQRNGRGWRQGNHWNTVLEYRYITEKLDGRRWQVLAVKDRFIKAFLKADQNVRVIEGDAVDTDEKVGADELAQTLADAAGDPRLLMVNKLKNDVTKLERRERSHTYGVADAVETANNLEAEIAKAQAELPPLEQDAAFVEKLRESGNFKAKVAGKTYTKRPDAEEAIALEIRELRGRSLAANVGPVPVDIEVNGFKLTARKLRYGDVTFSLERTSEYRVNAASLRGMEATIRSVQALPTEYRAWIEEKQTSVKSLRASAKAPFAQAESLAKRRALLASIEQDLQDNPVPPPQWLRTGAPVNTEIYVREGEALTKRVVEGHRWTHTDWLVSTDQGEVSYSDALDANGLPIYEDREFQSPVVEKPVAEAKQSLFEEPDQPQRTMTQAQRAELEARQKQGMARRGGQKPIADQDGGLFSSERDQGSLFRRSAPQGTGMDPDALQARLEGYLGRKVALRVVETLNGAAGSYRDGLIEIATNTPQDGTFTLDHEAIHALRDLGVFSQSEWAILAAKAKRDPALMRSIRQRYSRLDAEAQSEEAVGDLFARWQRGDYQTKGTANRIFAKLRNLFEAIRNAFAGRGFRTAEGVMEGIAEGKARESVTVGRGGKGGAFDPENPDIRYSIPEEPTPGFKRDEMPPPGSRTGYATAGAPRGGPGFADPDTEARYQDARKGISTPESLVERTRNWLTEGWHGLSRHWINLPNTPEYADLQQKLRAMEAAPGAAKERTVRLLEDMVAGMDTEELDLFTRKVILDDLSWETSQEHDLPFGLTPETVRSELAKIDTILHADPDRKVWKAVMKRRVVNRDIARQLVDAGVLEAEAIKNPAYYRHQVLEYARAQQKFAHSAGSKLRSPKWARRMGSTLDINANLLEAEFDWLNKALMDIPIAKSIEWIKKSKHNILNDLKRQARERNKAGIDAALAEAKNRLADGDGTEAENMRDALLIESWTGANRRIAMGFSGLAKIIEDGDLRIPPYLQAAADSLAGSKASSEPPFALLNWILDNNHPGSMEAAMVYKGIGLRNQIMRSVLGRNYADPMDVKGLLKTFAPEGYTTWQPDEGKLLFTVKTLPEHVIDGMLEKITAAPPSGIDLEAWRAELERAKSVLVVGGDRYTMILPQDVADTLNSLRLPERSALFDFLVEKPVRAWKRWVLINPRRWFKYNLNNTVGDLDALIAGNPRALTRAGQAARELYAVMKNGERPTARYEEAIERGVFDSGVSVQEIPDINQFSAFERFAEGSKTPTGMAKLVLRKAWNALQGSTQFRENVFRYAAYLDYVDRIEAGNSQAGIGYGASLPSMVDAVTDPKDRAALLARDLIGDYGAISHFGSGVRRTIIPFWSWMEMNTKRYKRLSANAWSQGVGKGLSTSGLAGATLGVRVTAALAVRGALLYGMIQMWNYLFFDDEEDEIDDQQGNQLHIILGRNAAGEIVTLRTQGALSDALSWFGFPEIGRAFKEYERGRGSLGEILAVPFKTTANKLLTSMSPSISVPLESALGKKLWPDVFNPRPNRDPWRNLASTFSLENELDLARDLVGAPSPDRGYARSWQESVIYRRDPGEIAYNAARGIAYDWKRRVLGQDSSSDFTSPRADAMRDYRTALKFGDTDAADAALDEMASLGVTMGDYNAMIKRAHPLSPIAKKDRKAFVEGLTNAEYETLLRAEEWYFKTFGLPANDDAEPDEEE